MNVNANWLPLALLAFVTLITNSADAQPPGPTSPPGLGQDVTPSVPSVPSVPGFVPEFVSARMSAPDLCAELDEYGDPIRCEAVGPDMAPWWNDDVCCDAAGCTELDRGACTGGAHRYWCENAVLYGDGRLDCVYEVPSYCEVYACTGPTDITAPPLEHAICCFSSGCYDHEGGPCGGFEIWCGHGVTNEDGTVSCQDGAY